MIETFLFWTVIVWLIGYGMGRSSAQHKMTTAPPPPPPPSFADTGTQLASDWVPEPPAPPSRPLDNATIMLYFGAFLVIAGVGLFVGLSDFDGTSKTVAVAAVALLFFGAGLYLYDKVDRLKPAAITLTAIGLLSMPLVGVAIYAYVTDQTYGSTIWFMTSLISLAFYGAAIWKIRQSLMGYLAVFMVISLWMSLVSVIDAPVYFFGWAGVILAMVYLLIAKRLKVWSELEAPLSVSASIMVPTTLVMMLLFGDSSGQVTLMHQGITVLLAAGFYAMATWLSDDTKQRLQTICLASALLPLAAALMTYDQTGDMLQTAYWISGVSIAELMMLALFKAQLPKDWLDSVGLVTVVGMFVAGLLSTGGFHWVEACWLVGVEVAACAFAAFYMRSKNHLVLGLVGLLLLPLMIGFMAIVPPVDREVLVSIYFALGLLMMFGGSYADKLVPGYRRMILVAYAAAWAFAVFLGNLPGFLFWGPNADPQWLPAVASLTGACLALVSAYFEGKPKIIYVFPVLANIGVWQWLDLAGNSRNYGLILLVMGGLNLAIYGLGKLQQMRPNLAKYWQPWAWSGLVGLLLWSMQTMFENYDTALDGRWLSGLFMIAAGALASYEAYKRHNRPALYVTGGIALLGMQWIMYTQSIDNYLVYTHMWAAYFGLLAWLGARDGLTQDRQLFTVLALLIQTLPLANEGLQGDTGYGLLLLFESVGIMIFGMLARDRLVSIWGLVVAVASVLYQLRSYQFFVLALLGAGVIGVGIWMLLRSEKHK